MTSKTNQPNEGPLEDLFLEPGTPNQRRYEALRAFHLEGLKAADVASRLGYTQSAVYSLLHDARAAGLEEFIASLFVVPRPGPKRSPKKDAVRDQVIDMRLRGFSVYDIQEALKLSVSATLITEILREEGFPRLTRRREGERPEAPRPDIPPESDVAALDLSKGRRFETQAAGLFVLLPMLVRSGFPKWVKRAKLPGSKPIPPISYALSLLTLKLLGTKRVSHVMDIAFDEGLGLFAGLNVLPKTTALTTYSYRVGREATLGLLAEYVKSLRGGDLLKGESFNLDFHAIPHRGDKSVLDRHYVSKRSRREKAVLTFFAQDAETRALCYSNADLRAREHADEVLRFVDFWEETYGRRPPLLIFDSQLTTYRNLAELDRRGIRFLTLRRRGKAMLRALDELPAGAWTTLNLKGLRRGYNRPKVYETRIQASDYPGSLRQIAAKNLGHENPTFLLTNDDEETAKNLLVTYAHRMLIENGIAENVDFFHLDALSSAVVLNVDLDVTLTVLANGLYRRLARNLKGFETAQPRQIWRRFLACPGKIRIKEFTVEVSLKRKAHHPLLLDSGALDEETEVPWWGGRTLQLNLM